MFPVFSFKLVTSITFMFFGTKWTAFISHLPPFFIETSEKC